MDPIALDLSERSYSIQPGFLTESETLEIRHDLLQARERGYMKTAAVGKARDFNSQIRRDEILWLDEREANTVQTSLLSRLDTLRQQLNRQLFLNLRAFEGHYAHYPAGGFYRRHLDRFREDDARTITAVLYLNPEWCCADGGKLRLFANGKSVDVEPRAGTLAVFLSGEIEHEVLESHAPRMTFTGWFKT